MHTKAVQQIEYHKTFETGPARLCMLLSGLKFEIETGMRLTNKTAKCSTILRREFGITGTRNNQYFGFLGLLVQAGIVSLKTEPKAEATEVA